MTYSDFIKECLNPPTDETDFAFWIDNLIFELKDVTVDKVADKINIEQQTTVAAAINKCLSFLKIKEQKVKSSVEDENFIKFRNNLLTLKNELSKILKKQSEEVMPKEGSTDYGAVLESYKNKIDDLKNELDIISNRVENQSEHMDSKLFSTVLNLIAILGIFVAIAFAGFGSVSLISKIDIDLDKNLYLSTFFIMLIGLFVYNFLLLLIYFIVKIVNKNLPNNNRSRLKFIGASWLEEEVINKFLIVVDVVLFLIVVALFFITLFLPYPLI